MIPDDFSTYIEYACINRDELDFDVFVLGGENYGNLIEHNIPHFYVTDDSRNPDKFNLLVVIPTTKEWRVNKELVILCSDSSHSDWSGLEDIKTKLTEWLSKPHRRLSKNSNLFVIIHTWNNLNLENNKFQEVDYGNSDLF